MKKKWIIVIGIIIIVLGAVYWILKQNNILADSATGGAINSALPSGYSGNAYTYQNSNGSSGALVPPSDPTKPWIQIGIQNPTPPPIQIMPNAELTTKMMECYNQATANRKMLDAKADSGIVLLNEALDQAITDAEISTDAELKKISESQTGPIKIYSEEELAKMYFKSYLNSKLRDKLNELAKKNPGISSFVKLSCGISSEANTGSSAGKNVSFSPTITSSKVGLEVSATIDSYVVNVNLATIPSFLPWISPAEKTCEGHRSGISVMVKAKDNDAGGWTPYIYGDSFREEFGLGFCR